MSVLHFPKEQRHSSWTPPPRPAWSPLSPILTLDGPLGLIFPPPIWTLLGQRLPSPTRLRKLNDFIAQRARIIEPDEDWIPRPIGPTDFVDLVALSCKLGPLAAADLADLLANDEPLLRLVHQTLEDVGANEMRNWSALATLGPTGLSPMMDTGVVFIDFERARPEPDNISWAILEWWTNEECQDLLEREARATIRLKDKNAAERAKRFLDPSFPTQTEPPLVELYALEELESPLPVEPDTATVWTPPPRDPPTIHKSAVWTPPALPEGIHIHPRALKEIRKERRFAEDRFADAIEVLSCYRQMRLGALAPSAFAIEARSKRFADQRCFADDSSFAAFGDAYRITWKGRLLTLSRHLKWGKSNNTISAMRVYYAWDEKTRTIIVGSAPRHLPIWKS